MTEGTQDRAGWRPSRRQVLVGGGAGLVVLGLGGAAVVRLGQDEGGPSLAIEDLPPAARDAPAGIVDYFDGADGEAIAKIGQAHAEALHDDGGQDRLLEAVTPTAEVAGGGAEALTAAVADDLVAGRAVAVDGWVLSAHEAAACVLFALVSSPTG